MARAKFGKLPDVQPPRAPTWEAYMKRKKATWTPRKKRQPGMAKE